MTSAFVVNGNRTELMVYSHCRIRIRTLTLIPNPMVTLYYAELLTLVQIWNWIPTQMVSQMVTVPILGTDLQPKDRSQSLLHTFQSGDQSQNLNQWEISAEYKDPSPSWDPNLDPAMSISHNAKAKILFDHRCRYIRIF